VAATGEAVAASNAWCAADRSWTAPGDNDNVSAPAGALPSRESPKRISASARFLARGRIEK
jgi:hypothetical protein